MIMNDETQALLDEWMRLEHDANLCAAFRRPEAAARRREADEAKKKLDAAMKDATQAMFDEMYESVRPKREG